MKGDEDTSDMDAEDTRNFLKRDSGIDITIGDKIYVNTGELQ